MSLASRLASARDLVVENFAYKLASLVISVTLFMVFRGAGAVQRSVDVPITAVLPAAYAGNAVLLGTGSFWEGVDVKGTALSVVIIDKLPFAAPDDPLLKARLNAIREQGGNPFFDEQVPQAVIALKQGVGRLIRDEGDFGVVMLCDTRLVTKGYGRSFITSLPPMRRTRSLEDVQAFLHDKFAGQLPAAGRA